MRLRVGAIAAAAAVSLTFMTGAASPSGGTPQPSVPSSAASVSHATMPDTPEVKAWKAKKTKEATAAGDPSPVFASADFVPSPSPGKKAPSGATAQKVTGYPVTGCTLQLVTYKSSTYNAAVGSSLTSCLTAAGTIQHTQQLYRLDWWGWAQRASGRRTQYNVPSMGYDQLDHCTTGFYNSWSAHVRGDIWKGGNWWFADVTTGAGLNCGGS